MPTRNTPATPEVTMPSRRDILGETDDLGAGLPPYPFPQPEDIASYLTHLEDACPVITADPIEAAEVGARYLIGEEIGSGAIGQVIEAFDLHLGRTVAIKILHGGAGVSRERLARFIAEAQITAQLEHPSVVPVHEIGRMPGGMPYFTMKRIRGESLEDIINHLRVGDEWYRQRYTGKQAIRIFYRLCQGVAYAHDRGVVHRDLKPANILLGEYGEVQIMDWGLAKVLGDSPLRKDIGPVRTVRDAPDLANIEGAIAGTPAYMSPEQARGDNETVGKTSDVYSLGLMLAEFLSLVRVFRNPGHDTTLAQVRAAGAVNLADLNPNLRFDPELTAIVRQCTQPDPGLRYPDAGHLAEDLRRYLEDRQIPIAPDLSARRVIKWSRRHPIMSGALAASAVIIALEILFYFCWRALF